MSRVKDAELSGSSFPSLSKKGIINGRVRKFRISFCRQKRETGESYVVQTIRCDCLIDSRACIYIYKCIGVCFNTVSFLKSTCALERVFVVYKGSAIKEKSLLRYVFSSPCFCSLSSLYFFARFLFSRCLAFFFWLECVCLYAFEYFFAFCKMRILTTRSPPPHTLVMPAQGEYRLTSRTLLQEGNACEQTKILF